MTIRTINQINDIKHLFYVQSAIVKNHNGFYWAASALEISIPAGGEYLIAMELSDTEIEMLLYRVVTNALDADVEFFEGGDFSGGTAIVFENTNRVTNKTLPIISVEKGVTIDVAGVPIFSAKVRGAAGRTGSVDYIETTDNSGIIMKPSTVYYFRIKNNDTGAKDFDFYFKISQHTD